MARDTRMSNLQVRGPSTLRGLWPNSEMSDLKHAAALALRLQTITSLVGLNGDEDQVNNTDRAVVLRFCAILDALERAAESHTYIRKVILQGEPSLS